MNGPESRARGARPRDAATLIIVDGSGRAARVLMGKRHPAHTFMPGKFVFPGGRIEAEDRKMSVAAALDPNVEEKLNARVRRPSPALRQRDRAGGDPRDLRGNGPRHRRRRLRRARRSPARRVDAVRGDRRPSVRSRRSTSLLARSRRRAAQGALTRVFSSSRRASSPGASMASFIRKPNWSNSCGRRSTRRAGSIFRDHPTCARRPRPGARRRSRQTPAAALLPGGTRQAAEGRALAPAAFCPGPRRRDTGSASCVPPHARLQ